MRGPGNELAENPGEIFESTDEPQAHNTHNAQKTASSGNFADIANYASADTDEIASRLLEALTDACRSLPITPITVRDALAPENIEDWRRGGLTGEALAVLAKTTVQRRRMDRGKRDGHYIERATCKHCGPIWLWTPGELLGCPWCSNRNARHG